MTRWNVAEIAFYGLEGRRRTIELRPDEVAILTGRSGTGKSAIISAIDYCLGSRSCKLPYYVRRRTIGVAVHWKNGPTDLIVGRVVPDSGVGTEKMFAKTGRELQLPASFEQLEGPTPRAAARKMIERSFRIADIEDADADEKRTSGRASIRHATPYMFLSADVIISNRTVLHDLNDPDKAKDIRATMPYFLQAVDQETVLAQRRLRQLEAALGRLERQEVAIKKSRSLLTERAMALLTQSAGLGMSATPDPTLSEQDLLDLLREVSSFEITRTDTEVGDELGALENERRQTVQLASEYRQRRGALRTLIKDSTGFETTISGQFQKLNLINHLKLDSEVCPVCQQKSQVGADIAKDIAGSLSLIEKEVASVEQINPELLDQLNKIEGDLKSTNDRIREIERQIRSAIQQNDALKRADDLAQARAIAIGRVEQFLETTAEDFQQPPVEFGTLRNEIEKLRGFIDPQALRDRIAHVENMVSNYASEMLQFLPSTAPLTDARLQFFADGRIRVIEAERQRQLNLVDVGSDQNYLAIHLALLFGLHKHFEQTSSPVPGLLVIDQISRPYYPKDERASDERTLEEMAQDDDRRSMGKIVDFIFEETAKAAGLQVLLIEHAYMESDARYVEATVERWTRANGIKLIPDDWTVRQA